MTRNLRKSIAFAEKLNFSFDYVSDKSAIFSIKQIRDYKFKLNKLKNNIVANNLKFKEIENNNRSNIYIKELTI